MSVCPYVPLSEKRDYEHPGDFSPRCFCFLWKDHPLPYLWERPGVLFSAGNVYAPRGAFSKDFTVASRHALRLLRVCCTLLMWSGGPRGDLLSAGRVDAMRCDAVYTNYIPIVCFLLLSAERKSVPSEAMCSCVMY